MRARPTAAPKDPLDFTEISAPLTLSRYVADTWRARDFIVTLAQARLHAANHGTAIGMLWHLANPLLLAGVFLLVFGVILQTARGQGNFPAYLVIGIFTFSYASRMVTNIAGAPRQNRRLMAALHFPRVVFPVAEAIKETVAFAPALLTMFAITLVTGDGFHWTWPFTVPVLVVEGVFALGVGLLMARFAFRYRDIEQVLPFVMRLWLYLSGIFYGLDLVRDRAGALGAQLFELNPMFVFIDLNRALVMEGRFAGERWLAGLIWAVVAFVAGVLVFRGAEQDMGNG